MTGKVVYTHARALATGAMRVPPLQRLRIGEEEKAPYKSPKREIERSTTELTRQV